MNYGLQYKGSKNSIAAQIMSFVAETEKEENA